MLLVVIPYCSSQILLGLEAVSAYKKLTVDGFHIQPYLDSLKAHFPMLKA